jgi:HD-GYP domain-containing protein (c-di-GMP phosphodiesterase class II)
LLRRKKIAQFNINSSTIKKNKKEQHSYILAEKRFLHLGDNLEFNIFSNYTPTSMSLFLQSDTVINEKQQQKLNQIEHIYVSESDKSKYENFVEDRLANIVKDNSLSLDEKTEIIYTTSTELTNSLYDNPDALENVQRSKKIVTPILHSVIYNNDTISSYIKIIEYDYYTHTHSLNVSIYAMCLGAELKLTEERLTALGRAALLHDLGKSKIDHDIVNKNGKLTDDEYQQMKNHPALGYEIAINIGINNQDILDGIRHHHEKLDGMGYPDKLKESEITIFARIIGVCDVFDALTTKRSYKQAMSSFDALQLMKSQMSTHLDMNIVNIFIKMLHK